MLLYVGSDFGVAGRIALRSNRANGWLIAAVSCSVVAIVSWVDFGLYLKETSHSGEGVGLYAAAAVLFTAAAVGFFIGWGKVRRRPEE